MSTDLHHPIGNDATTAEKSAMNDGDHPLDLDLLMRRCMGRIELVDRLLASFDDRFPKELNQIEQCLAAGDVERLSRLTHQLKGTTANISAPELLAIAAKMEESARALQLDDVVLQVTEIQKAWHHFQEYKASIHRVTAAGCGPRGVGK